MSNNEAFIAAVNSRDIPTIKQLLSATPPADINCPFNTKIGSKYRKGTALHHCVARNDAELLEVLLAFHPDLNSANALGQKPLHINMLALYNTNSRPSNANVEKIFIMLIKAGADLNTSLWDIESFREAEKLEHKLRLADIEERIEHLQYIVPEEGVFAEWVTKEELQKELDGERNNYKMMSYITRPLYLIVGKPQVLQACIKANAAIPSIDIQFLLELQKLEENNDRKQAIEAALLLLTKAPALQKLCTSIKALMKHGELLQQDPSSKSHGLQACEIATLLEDEVSQLMDAMYSKNINDIKSHHYTIEATLKKAFDDMGNHRTIFGLLGEIAIALTGIGLIVLAIKYLVDGYGFFTTRRQDKILEARKAIDNKDLLTTEPVIPQYKDNIALLECVDEPQESDLSPVC